MVTEHDDDQHDDRRAMLCSARAPPKIPSASGSTEPTINRR